MKLPIKKKYFDLIKEGKKTFELRDAHITFICEETGETLRKDIESVNIEWFQVRAHGYADIPWEDDYQICFRFKKEEER
jgi:hypothetical protein